MKQCSNHKLCDDHLIATFYRSVNSVIKHTVDIMSRGSFMALVYKEETTILDKVTSPTGLGTLETLKS